MPAPQPPNGLRTATATRTHPGAGTSPPPNPTRPTLPDMDARDARRAAETAARDLINTRAALIGELGVAAARHTDTTTGVTRAQHHAQALLDYGPHGDGHRPAAQQARGLAEVHIPHGST